MREVRPVFIRNCWYVGAWDWEVRREALFRRTLLNENIVFYRDRRGAPHALVDRCSHRHAPLSEGRLVGDEVECPYHGIRFDGTGACTHVPSQKTPPPDASVRSYPVVERHHFIWIWMGDPARADPDLIEDFHWLEDPGWRFRGDILHFENPYILNVENLLDLAHLTFVHKSSLGTEKVASTRLKTEREGNRVRVSRLIEDSPAPPLFQKAGQFAGNVDRWQIVEFAPPAFLKLTIGAADAGTGGYDSTRGKRIGLRNLNAITPETDRTTHYFRSICHDFLLDDTSISDMLFHGGREAMAEDQFILKATRDNMETFDDGTPYVDFNQDAGGIAAKNIIEALIAAENEEQGARRAAE